MSNEIKSIIKKKIPTQKSLGADSLAGELYQIFKEE